MHSIDLNIQKRPSCSGFTLVEMLVVIAVMSILMTAGAIGLGGAGGNPVTSAVATTESLFDEARAIAVGQRTNARVMIAQNLTNKPEDNLRRVIVMYEELGTDGLPKTNPTWALSSRGTVLPERAFFSQNFSSQDHEASGAAPKIETLNSGVKAPYYGSYYTYVFNAEGICTTPGASVVIGSGARNAKNPTDQPRVTSDGKRDFGGFVIWKNGRTSIFRSPDQISTSIKSLATGSKF